MKTLQNNNLLKKDLIKKFINLLQHTAAREELQATKTDIIALLT